MTESEFTDDQIRSTAFEKIDLLDRLFAGAIPWKAIDAGFLIAGLLPGRSPAFRRIVLEVYDFQCAACGLRIKLPDADLTFVDGAHLIPFQHSRNDHPTNGLALCKNHHWAMDRFLLVPTPDRVWKVSPRLDARRSPGEEALMKLHGQPVLPPHDDAFLPDPAGLAWRTERIYA